MESHEVPGVASSVAPQQGLGVAQKGFQKDRGTCHPTKRETQAGWWQRAGVPAWVGCTDPRWAARAAKHRESSWKKPLQPWQLQQHQHSSEVDGWTHWQNLFKNELPPNDCMCYTRLSWFLNPIKPFSYNSLLFSTSCLLYGRDHLCAFRALPVKFM